jgi:hypothetical protein
MTGSKEIPPKTRERLLDSNIPRVTYMAQKLFGLKAEREILYSDSLVHRLTESLKGWNDEIL